MPFRSPTPALILRAWFLLSVVAAISALIWLVNIPSETGYGLLFGFSSGRWLMIAALLGGGLVFFGLAILRSTILENIAERLSKQGIFLFTWIVWMSAGTFTGYALTSAPIFYRPYYLRLLPISSWLTAAGLIAWIVLFLLISRDQKGNIKLSPGTRRSKAIFFLVIFTLAWFPRSLDLDRFVTVDEPTWLERSEDFILAIHNRNFTESYITEHPGLTLLWSETLGLVWRLSGSEDGILENPDVTPHQLSDILERNGFSKIDLLVSGRYFVALISTIAIAGVAVYAIELIGFNAAMIGGVLLALDPFYIAHTRLLTMDGLLASLVALSVLAYLSYIQTHRRRDLFISSLAAGLCWLTKTPGLFLIPMVGTIGLVQAVTQVSEEPILKRLFDFARGYVFWGLLGLLFFFLLFPAMWTAPIETITDMISETVKYAAEGHRGPVFYNGQIYPQGIIPGIGFAVVNFFWRTTPVVLAGLLSLVLAWKSRKQGLKIIGLLFLAMALFVILQSIGTKKFDRYFLTAFPLIDLLAGFGLASLLSALRSKSTPWAVPITFSLAILVLWPVIATYPYFISYYNPLMGGPARAPETMLIGWGEGLDEAARYLNNKPDAGSLAVISWYNRGSFDYFFIGESQSIPVNHEPTPQRLAEIMAMDYAVIYIHQWQRGLPANLLALLEDRQPEHTIWIDGTEYVRIYALNGR